MVKSIMNQISRIMHNVFLCLTMIFHSEYINLAIFSGALTFLTSINDENGTYLWLCRIKKIILYPTIKGYFAWVGSS